MDSQNVNNSINSEWNDFYKGKYEVQGSNKSLRLVAFIFNLISTILLGPFLITLCWMIPMTVHSWGIYKGKNPNTTCFAVFNLIFLNIISGILLLCAKHDNI